MAMQIGMGFGKFLARVLFQELGVSVPSSVFHVLFITRSLHAYMQLLQPDLGNRLWYKQHLYTSSVDPQAQVLCGGRFWVAHSGPRG